MDEHEFNTLIGFLIRRVNPDMNADKVKTSLTLLRDNPELFEDYSSNKKQYDGNPTIGDWQPFCFLSYILVLLIFIIGFGLDHISYNYPIFQFCS
jgi:hypothetical protein